MNNVIFNGNLVDDIKATTTQDGKKYAYGKIGVYNGKTKQGEQRQSMFFDIVVFGRDAEDLEILGRKGKPIVVMGRLEEDRTTGRDGREYLNKRVVCNSARVLEKVEQINTQDPFGQYE